MDDDTHWWQLPRRLLELSRGAAAAAAAAAAAGTATASSKSADCTSGSELSVRPSLRTTPLPLACLRSSQPTGASEDFGPVYSNTAVRNNGVDDTDSTEGSSMTESESETDEDTVTENSSQQMSPPRSEGARPKEGGGAGVGSGGGGTVERPQSSIVSASGRRPSTAPSPFANPALRPHSGTVIPSASPQSLQTAIASNPPPQSPGSSFPKVCSSAAHALAQRVQSVMGGMANGSVLNGGVGASSATIGNGLAGMARSPPNGMEAAINIGRWPSSIQAPSSTTLCQAGYSVTPRRSELQPSTARRVPPPSLMASPWWRNMEEQSPAFAAVSQRFHAIAHAQARERLAGNLARLAVLHEAEEATREQRDALRMALGMPALARWANTKSHEPLPAFLLRTLAALLDLSVELVKHAVLMGWVLLGVFNRLLYEVLTANRSAFGHPYKR